MFPERIQSANWVGKTHPERDWCHPISWVFGWKRRKGSLLMCTLDSSWAGMGFAATIALKCQTPDSSAFKCRHALTALQEASSLQLLLGGFGLLNWAGLPLWDSPACGHVTQPHKFPLIALYALNCSVPLRTLADVFPQRFSFQNSPLTFQLLWLRWILSFGSSSQ
jgi:hypothetical protein